MAEGVLRRPVSAAAKRWPALAGFLRMVTGRILHRPDVRCPYVVLGKGYGAHAVWPGSLVSTSTVYSFGIGTDVSFDFDLIQRWNCTVHAFDPTPVAVDWVTKNVSHPKFIFHQLGLAARDGIVALSPPRDPAHVSYFKQPEGQGSDRGFEVRRLSSILGSLGHQHLAVLKMDIEGFEYEAIEDLLGSGIRPDVLAVEFHHGMYGFGADDTKGAVRDLGGAGYCLFYVSSSGREYGFVRRDLVDGEV